MNMKHKPLPAVSIVFLVLIGTFSCSDSDDGDVFSPGQTKTDLITAAPWVRTALISTPAYDWYGNGVSDTDVLSIMLPCEKDNLDLYGRNGVFTTDEGPTKCDPSDPQTWTLAWRFASNETKLIFDGTGIHDEYTLLELTETTLKFQITFDENGVAYTHVETYSH
jgi:hypothetical protein